MIVKMGKNKVESISIIRVLSMISIIAGHFFCVFGIYDYQLSTIGVEIFLMISGFLYSNKQISNKLLWLENRAKRILLPYWIALAVLLLSKWIFGIRTSWNTVTLYALNMQGIDRVFTYCKYSSLSGFGHTWFVTIIMICYFITLLLKSVNEVERVLSKNKKRTLVTVGAIQIALAFFGVQIGYIICFLIGYFWPNHTWDLNAKMYKKLSVAVLFSIILRLVTHVLWDNTIFYNLVIARWTFVVLAIWIIVTITKICDNSKKLKEIATTKTWTFLDQISYELYLSHYVFMKGTFATANFLKTNWGIGLSMIILSFISACILLYITEFIINHGKRKQIEN